MGQENVMFLSFVGAVAWVLITFIILPNMEKKAANSKYFKSEGYSPYPFAKHSSERIVIKDQYKNDGKTKSEMFKYDLVYFVLGNISLLGFFCMILFIFQLLGIIF